MDSTNPSIGIVRFGVFELDVRSGELRRHGQKIRLPHQSFQILRLLLTRPGEVVSRDELRHALWASDTFVDFDVGLNSAIRKLREALDESAEDPRFVETLPRRGYRFIAHVDPLPADRTVKEAETPRPMPPTPAAVLPPPVPRRLLGPTRAAWMAAGLFLALAAATSGVVYYSRGASGAFRSMDAAAPIRSLAVLPFENLTGDAGQEYFVDAVTDALTTHLAQIDGLSVASRTSAKQYRQPNKRIPVIGDELKVEGVLEGSVARSGDRVRITAQLIHSATDHHVWARNYDGDVTQILALQHRIASDVATAMGRRTAEPPGGSRARQAVDAQAYDAYLKGTIAMGLQRYEGYRTAVSYFEQAVDRQPDFGEAYAMLAHSRVQFLFGGPLSPREVIPKAEAAARRALELDETLVFAHRALGQVLTLYYWKWDEGDKAFQRAAELSRHLNVWPAGRPGLSLIRSGRLEEAIAEAELARKQDPLSFAAQVNVGTIYRAAGQHDRAIAEFRRALETNPGHTRAHFQLGVTYVAMGRLADAVRELETAVGSGQRRNSRFEAYLGYAYAAAGRARDARRTLQALEARRREEYVSSFGMALIHDALGDRAAALIEIERAYEERAVEFAQMTQYPAFTTVASELRFEAVLRRIGLPR